VTKSLQATAFGVSYAPDEWSTDRVARLRRGWYVRILIGQQDQECAGLWIKGYEVCGCVRCSVRLGLGSLITRLE